MEAVGVSCLAIWIKFKPLSLSQTLVVQVSGSDLTAVCFYFDDSLIFHLRQSLKFTLANDN